MSIFKDRELESKERDDSMIVKYINSVREWNYIDDISHVKAGNKSECKQGEIVPIIEIIDNRKDSSEVLKYIEITQNDKQKCIITSEAVYLMNDKGQTIERLV